MSSTSRIPTLTISVIDGATNEVTATIDVGSFPSGIAVNSTTNTVYVTNPGSNTISVIDGATNTLTATIVLGGHSLGVAVNPKTNLIYVTNVSSSSVLAIKV